MSFLRVNLGTYEGALLGARRGAVFCLLQCSFLVLTFAFAIVFLGTTPFLILKGSAEIALFLIAGIRLWQGRGAYLSIAAALVLGTEILLGLARTRGLPPDRVVLVSSLTALALEFLALVLIAKGARAAWAIRRHDFDDDLAETFS